MNKLFLINQALKELRLPTITALSDSSMEQFPYNLLETLLQESIIDFSFNQLWNWKKETITLNYTANSSSFNLSDYKIDSNRILFKAGVYFTENNSTQYLVRMQRQLFKRTFPIVNQIGRPQSFSIENENLYLSKIPDKDYGIKIVTYKHIPLLISETDEILNIPDKYQRPIIENLKINISALLNKDNSVEFLNDYIYSLSVTQKENQVRAGGNSIMPSTIRW